MPYQWIDPELFLEFAGVAVYHCYEEDGPVSYYWYTTDPSDDNRVWTNSDSAQFDVRTLPHLGLDIKDFENHATIIEHAIQAGLITGEPAEREPPLIVKIEVNKGIAFVVEQPPGVRVEIMGNISPQSAAPLESMSQTQQNGFLDLSRVSDRLAFVVTDLNGLISSLVNEEVTPGDLAGKFGELLVKLDQLEAATQELGDVFWQ